MVLDEALMVNAMHVPVSTTDHGILRTSGSDWANLVGVAPCPALRRMSHVLINGSFLSLDGIVVQDRISSFVSQSGGQ